MGGNAAVLRPTMSPNAAPRKDTARMKPPSEKCEHCVYHEAIGFNYCRKCGYHLQAGEIHTMRPNAKSKAFKFCGNCGKEVRVCNCQMSSK
jgi:hypothetical protein